MKISGQYDVTVQPLTLAMALELARHLGERDRAEITRTQPDLDRWARSRLTLNGVPWAIVVHGQVLAIGGLIFEHDIGTFWLAGREGWSRYVKHALRVWREILAHAREFGLTSLRCEVYPDNARAKRFVEHLGFSRCAELREDVLSYERVVANG